MTPLPLERIAGAPISWGVCEVPDWGYQPPAEQVLRELAAIGLEALELGPEGFLPTDPKALGALLAQHGLRLVGGFVPLVLHRPERAEEMRVTVRRAAAQLAAAGATVMVVAATTEQRGYDAPRRLTDPEWETLVAALQEVEAIAASAGLTATLHPHVGTAVESADDVGRILDRTAVPLCLDTGHLLIGGSDPLELARTATGRIGHVHLKDVDEGRAAAVRSGGTTYGEAVSAGLYRPLGAGDAQIADVVDTLERGGYGGQYVLEQDVRLRGEPAAGEGPAEDVRRSVTYLTAGGARPGPPAVRAWPGERGRD